MNGTDDVSISRDHVTDAVARLRLVLRDCAPCVVAVSGGVDSLTLATLAQQTIGDNARMMHAISPAVPPAATARVKQLAARQGWRLTLIDAGEFDDPRYRENPSNRCYFCKSHLYDALTAMPGQIISGTNLDDLQDFRPGLAAARERGVRHPYVEAQIGKTTLRAIARELGLGAIAALPAAPCLASRVETGMRIESSVLAFADAVETLVRESLNPSTVRCRIRRGGVVIELDDACHTTLTTAHRASLVEEATALATRFGVTGAISLAPYVRGSAFLRERS